MSLRAARSVIARQTSRILVIAGTLPFGLAAVHWAQASLALSIGVVPTTMIALTAPVVGLLVVVDTALTAASAVVATQAPAATVGDANDLRFSARRTRDGHNIDSGERLPGADGGYRRVMTRFGYTMLCEQSGPKELVRDVQIAEHAGFDFAVISDHYFPWVEAMGHSPYAWSVLGAAAEVTERIDLMTYVTCPIKRYHPAVVAQKAATVAILSDGRFTLGLGAGENLNEHVVGGGWPPVNLRHEMLGEAVEIIRQLWGGDYVNFSGKHFQVDSAKIWDLPPRTPDLGIAVSGWASCSLAGHHADLMIAVEPKSELVQAFESAGGHGKPRIGQVPVAYDPNRDAAIARARELFGWFGGGWKVNSELPGTAAFEAASRFVRADDIVDAIPCGSDVEPFVHAVSAFTDAGFTHVALCQVGGDTQSGFVEWAEHELLPALRNS